MVTNRHWNPDRKPLDCFTTFAMTAFQIRYFIAMPSSLRDGVANAAIQKGPSLRDGAADAAIQMV
jgi:hypothetical protein